MLGLVTQPTGEWTGTSGKEHQPPGCANANICVKLPSAGPPLSREQFAYLATCGLAFLIGLELDNIQPAVCVLLAGMGAVSR